MILPTKHVRPDRALIGVGAELLEALREPMTVSKLWDTVRGHRARYAPSTPIAYDWFILAVDLLFLLGAVELDQGLVRKTQ